MLEISVEDQVCEWASKNGWLVAKLQYLGNTGWPDRFFLKNGHHVFIEFKRPKGGRREPKQIYWRDQIHYHGGNATFINSAEDGIALLKTYG